jgi:flagellar hook assembly protein FlgD
LIAKLSVQPFVSPNGYGIGDAAQIRFNVLKVDAAPEVQIYTFDGRLVNTLKGQLQTDQSHLYSWSAQDRNGAIVPPDSYLCRISMDAQAGAENLLRVINVAY